MSTGVELLDIPVEFEFKGKVYKVSRKITFQMEQMFADWVYNTALDRLERQRALARETGQGMTEEQYNKQMDRIADNFSAGKYEWEGSCVQESLNQWPGNKYMMWLRFKRYDPKVEFSLIEEIFNSNSEARRLARLLNPQPPVAEKEEEAAAGNKDNQSQPAAS